MGLLLFVLLVVGSTYGGYNPEDWSENVLAESLRLRAQVKMFERPERELYEKYFPKDQHAAANVLLLGCGPGHLASEILFKRWPLLNITCVEINNELLRLGKEHLKQYGDSFHYIHGNITDLPFLLGANDVFDVVIVRLVLQHISAEERVKAVRNARTFLKPGGVFIGLSVDASLYDVIEPQLPVSKKLDDAYGEFRENQDEEGPFDYTGREVQFLLREAGFIDVRVEVVCGSSLEFGNELVFELNDSRRYELLRKNGLATKEEIEMAEQEMRESFSSPDSQALFMSFLFVNVGFAPRPPIVWNDERLREYWNDSVELKSKERFEIVVLGEEDDWDLQIDGELKALRGLGFPPPRVHYSPTQQTLDNLPKNAPIILVSHTTDETYVNNPDHALDPTDRAAGLFLPTPPLGQSHKNGDVFFWGWPEPFPFISDQPWYPAKTAVHTLYPFRNNPIVILSSCYSKRLEGIFSHVVGLSYDEHRVPLDPRSGRAVPTPELMKILYQYMGKSK